MYKHGVRHGEGISTVPCNGSVTRGTWQRNHIHGPAEVQMSGEGVTIFANFDEGIMRVARKVVFRDDDSIYVGNGSDEIWLLHGRGILLNKDGIHVGAWSADRPVGIEHLHLCDDAGTVVELEHTPRDKPRDNQPREIGRSIGNPLFRVPHDDTSPLAELQRLELAKFVGKRRTTAQFQIHLHVEGGQNGDFCLDTTLERRPLLKDVRVFSNSLQNTTTSSI